MSIVYTHHSREDADREERERGRILVTKSLTDVSNSFSVLWLLSRKNYNSYKQIHQKCRKCKMENINLFAYSEKKLSF